MYLYRDANKKLNYVFKCAKPKKKQRRNSFTTTRKLQIKNTRQTKIHMENVSFYLMGNSHLFLCNNYLNVYAPRRTKNQNSNQQSKI